MSPYNKASVYNLRRKGEKNRVRLKAITLTSKSNLSLYTNRLSRNDAGDAAKRKRGSLGAAVADVDEAETKHVGELPMRS